MYKTVIVSLPFFINCKTQNDEETKIKNESLIFMAVFLVTNLFRVVNKTNKMFFLNPCLNIYNDYASV